MRVLLLSAVFQNRKPILKFYDPESCKIILVDNVDYKQYCYVTPEKANEIREWQGINNIETVTIFDVIKDTYREMAKVTCDNPMIIYQLNEDGVAWESDIKYYQSFLYDMNMNVGSWYDLKDGKIQAIKSDNIFDISKIDMDSVVQTDLFKKHVKNWASILSQDIPKIKRLAFDIEVEVVDNMPDPSQALQRVTAISFHSDDLKQVFTLKRPEIPMGDEDKDKDYTIIWYDDEKQLLEDAFALIDKYPVVLTYNGDMFDMPYLYNRAIMLGIEYNPFKMMQRKATLNNGVHIDLYGVFSNRSLKIYAFNAKYIEDKLDTVSEAMLGEKKTEYDGSLTDIPLNLLSKYCYNDSRLTYNLSSFNNDLVMNLLIILCRIGNMTIDDISRLSIGNWIKSMFYFEHRKNNQLIPRSVDFPKVEASTKAGIKDKKYKGAVVLEPKKGVHFNVTVMDFASLYPSIIKTKNISYETVCCPHEECKTNKIPDTEHWSCTKKSGIVSLLIGSLKELRVNHFKVLLRKAKTDEEREKYDMITQALKIYLNASYGVIGFDNFPLYFLPTAEAVTAIGRDIILKTVKVAESEGLTILAGDTDSIFIHKPTKNQIQKLIEFTREHYAIDLEVDKEYRYLVLSNRKKNYFGVKKDGKLDIKGLAGKKSNTPPFVKALFNDILDDLKIILVPDDFPPAKVKISQKIKNVVGNFDNIPLDDFAFKIMINKDPAEYKVKPQVLKAAEQLDTKPQKGQFVRFIKTWKKPNVKPIQLVSRGDIDKDKYIQSLETVMSQITEPMEIDLELLTTGSSQSTLTQW